MIKKLASPAWAMLEYGWYPLLLLVSTPWFLGRLGVDLYGHWMLLNAAVGFGGILNVGTGAATIKSVSADLGRSSAGGVIAIRASLGVALLGGGILATLVLMLFWLGATSMFSRMGDPAVAQMTGVAAAILIWLEQVDNVFSSSLKGAEQFGLAARLEIASKTVQIGAAYLVLWKWHTLPALYATLFVVCTLRLIAKLIAVRQIFSLRTVRPSFVGASGILQFARWGWVQGVGGVMFGVADRMLVGSLLGASSLAYYSVATQLAMQVHAAAAAGLSFIFPMVSRSLAADHAFSIRKVSQFSVGANVLLSSGLALVLLVGGPTILPLWLGTTQAAPVGDVLPYLVIAYWVLALNVAPHYILLSLGRVKFVALANLAAGLIFVGLMPLAAKHYGVIGVAMARTLYGLIICANFVPLIAHIRKEKIA